MKYFVSNFFIAGVLAYIILPLTSSFAFNETVPYYSQVTFHFVAMVLFNTRVKKEEK